MSCAASTKVASQDALVRFDVEETRRILTEWGQQISPGELRNVLIRVAHKIDLGHKMLSAERLIPLRGISAIVSPLHCCHYCCYCYCCCDCL